MYLDILEQPAPDKFQDGIKPKKQAEGVAPVSDIDYKVVRNDQKILSLSVSAEGCGAYCENYTSDFNFDAETGRLLGHDDLFTPAGAVAIGKNLDSRQQARLKAHIKKLQAESDALERAAAKTKSAPDKDEVERLTETIDMFQKCVGSVVDPELAKYRGANISSFAIGKDGITFSRERCSNHAMRALDELGHMHSAFSLKELAPHLSAYGKYLLLGGERAGATGGPFNQVLFGSVGQAPITLRLRSREPDGSQFGTYFYNKYRTPIPLSGKLAGTSLVLEEMESKDKVLPAIRMNIQGESVKGVWVGNGKQIPFEAGP
jgi:hypothetical protein